MWRAPRNVRQGGAPSAQGGQVVSISNASSGMSLLLPPYELCARTRIEPGDTKTGDEDLEVSSKGREVGTYYFLSVRMLQNTHIVHLAFQPLDIAPQPVKRLPPCLGIGQRCCQRTTRHSRRVARTAARYALTSSAWRINWDQRRARDVHAADLVLSSHVDGEGDDFVESRLGGNSTPSTFVRLHRGRPVS